MIFFHERDRLRLKGISFILEKLTNNRLISGFAGTGMDSEISKSSPVSSKESKRSKDSKDKKNGKSEENGKNGNQDVDDLDTYACTSSAFLKDMTGANEE